jgi:Na+-transporting methylmalonyl-CoA/oxaloacetate decarboxylase gamma subunit
LPATSWLIGILLTVSGVALVLAVVLIAVPVLAVSREGRR